MESHLMWFQIDCLPVSRHFQIASKVILHLFRTQMDILSQFNSSQYYLNESFPPSVLNWSIDFNQIDHLNYKSDIMHTLFYPARVFTTGEALIFKVAARPSDLDPSCEGLGDRFRIYVHHPNELPWAHHQYYEVDVKQILTLNIVPHRIIASQKLKTAYTAERRRCYFEGERQLKYLRHYTKRNCELECWVNMTIKHCGCVQFWMPRKKLIQDFCDPLDLESLQESLKSSRISFIR